MHALRCAHTAAGHAPRREYAAPVAVVQLRGVHPGKYTVGPQQLPQHASAPSEQSSTKTRKHLRMLMQHLAPMQLKPLKLCS